MKAKDDARAKLAETQGALDEANNRIGHGVEWYEGVRESYRGGESAQ